MLQTKTIISLSGGLMKRSLVVLLVLSITILLTGIVSAKGITAKGVKVGLNLANVGGDDVEDGVDSKMGLAVGGFLTYSLNNKIAIQPEIFYSQKGFKIDESEMGMTVKSTMALNYLEIPILGVYSVSKNISVFAGPSIGLYMNGEMKFEMSGEFMGESFDESETEEIKSEEITSPEFGLVVGGAYSLGKISIGARYSMGLTNMPDEEDVDMKNKVIQILLGISF
jgi:hypothetical protein